MTVSVLDKNPAVHTNKGVKIVKCVTIQQPPEVLYTFWRRFENLPRFMSHLISVEQVDPLRSHWVSRGPRNKKYEWDALVINERPHELIAWKTLEGSEISHAGSVRFETAPGNRGTEVTVSLEFEPPGGKWTRFFAWISRDNPGSQIESDLRAFKALMEQGEIPGTSVK